LRRRFGRWRGRGGGGRVVFARGSLSFALIDK
jgi:hypothetical protein